MRRIHIALLFTVGLSACLASIASPEVAIVTMAFLIIITSVKLFDTGEPREMNNNQYTEFLQNCANLDVVGFNLWICDQYANSLVDESAESVTLPAILKSAGRQPLSGTITILRELQKLANDRGETLSHYASGTTGHDAIEKALRLYVTNSKSWSSPLTPRKGTRSAIVGIAVSVAAMTYVDASTKSRLLDRLGLDYALKDGTTRKSSPADSGQTAENGGWTGVIHDTKQTPKHVKGSLWQFNRQGTAVGDVFHRTIDNTYFQATQVTEHYAQCKKLIGHPDTLPEVANTGGTSQKETPKDNKPALAYFTPEQLAALSPEQLAAMVTAVANAKA